VRNVKKSDVEGYAFAAFWLDSSSGTTVVAEFALLSGRGLRDPCPSFEDELALRPDSASGNVAITLVPFPFDWISMLPPNGLTRSCIPRKPTPTLSPEAILDCVCAS
jgi:hypothetical protein